MHPRLTAACLVLPLIFPATTVLAEITGPPDAARVEFFEKLLPEKPRGLGAPISDRKAWDELAARSSALRDSIHENAEAALREPMPEMTDELYLDYSETGNRSRGQAVLGARRGRLRVLTLAECFENQGRYLPAIEATIRALAAEKSWVYPAHDGSLRNFKGEVKEIDLGAANLNWQLATANYWLGEKLSPVTRQLVADQLELRCFQPFTGMVMEGVPRRWWLNSVHNWNAVCLAGVTGTALAQIESRPRRAFFAAAAEKYIESFLSSFTPDGYCSEGLGYWNYGFGHFLMLTETLKQATGGKVDWMSQARIKPIALFGRRMEILPGIYPAFADCHLGTRPGRDIMEYLSRRYDWHLDFSADNVRSRNSAAKNRPADGARRSSRRNRDIGDSLFGIGLYAFPNSLSAKKEATQIAAEKNVPATLPLRDWFSDAGILLCRPKPGAAHTLGAALKGGHNGENHNHNDVGSFVVALGKSTPLLDPGSEVYTRGTFSARRYESNLLNSFGHAVPRVAGELQAAGSKHRAKILKADFTETADTLAMDISSAYPVESLEKLVRTFVFSRAGAGMLTVTDEVEFSKPENFGAALITLDKWEAIAPRRLKIGEGADAVQVQIIVEGGEIRIDPQEIHEETPGDIVPIRLGLDFTHTVKKAKITTIITSAE
jgi:hypothetical protein